MKEEDLIDALLAAGTPLSLVVRVASVLGRTERMERECAVRRAGDAERQRGHRERPAQAKGCPACQ